MHTPEQFKSQWNQLKGVILENFDELTAEDIAAINGKREVLISKIQARYGVTKDIAEEQLTEFEESAVLPGLSGGKTTSTHGRESSSIPRSGSSAQVRGASSTGSVKGAPHKKGTQK
jgi:uncharacterized protein YjbJ (UPF0337 family)